MLESDKFWTTSNVISLVRLVITIPVVWALAHQMYVLAFCLCWFAAFTDWLDGRVARATNTVSEWGKVVDPIADKVLVGAVVVMLLLDNRLPLWFVLCVVARDIVIVLGGLYSRRYTQEVLPSLMIGKIAVSAVALTGVSAMMLWNSVTIWLIYISCALLAVSLLQYGMRLHGIIRQTQAKTHRRS